MENKWFSGFFKKTSEQKIKEAHARAGSGDPESQFALGLELELVAEGQADMEEAASWYIKASEQHHSLAQYHLALLYAKGSGVEEDKLKSASLMLDSANGGNADAQFAMGILFYRRSVSDPAADPVDCRMEGFKWFHLAGSQNREGARAYCETITRKMTVDDVKTATQRVNDFRPRV